MTNPMLNKIRKRAAGKHRTIVFPEAADPRVRKAATFLAKEKICRVVLIGETKGSGGKAYRRDLASDYISFIPLHATACSEEMIANLIERRKHKGLSRQQAKELMQQPLYAGAGLVATGKADGCVAGSMATTSEVIRAAIQCIGIPPGIDTVSSTFLMALKEGRTVTFADCGVVPYPDKYQLADIAVASAKTHTMLTEEEPVVAMLSYSTKGSASHERVDLVVSALEIARQKAPGLPIDGEFQFDAGYLPEVAQKKAPNSKVAGKANVFIFPNLDAGNIAYKIAERLGGAEATGPILQGLNRPMMDLSRGCSWQDIVNAACVAVLMGEDDSGGGFAH